MIRKLFLGCFGITCIVLFACAGKSSRYQEAKIKSMLLVWSIPVFNPDSGKVSNMRDSVLIYHLDDLVLYRVAYTYTQYNKNAQKGNTNTISDDPKTIDFSKTRYKNFIYRRNSLTGFVYDSLSTNSHLTFNVDSFERKKTFKGSKFYETSHDKIVESMLNKDRSELIEKYASITKPDESYSDTSYYYFSRGLNDVNYSFSKEADSAKKMKLNKIVFIYNPVPKNDHNKVAIPRREILLEIKKITVSNKKEILLFSKSLGTTSH